MILPIIFTALPIVTLTLVNCDLINLDDIWTSTSTFHRDHDYALIGHVIKTLPLFITDCLVACQETLRCFSVNYINFHNGTYNCELNWSNKKQSKDSFVRREGYEYAEPETFLHCEGELCAKKEEICISDGRYFGAWIGLNDIDKEDSFDSLISARLETFSLHGGAAIQTKDSRKAIYFDGIDDYATIPKFDIRKTDYTIAFWLKGAGSIYGYWSIFNDRISFKVRQFSIYVHNTKIYFNFFNTANTLITGESKFLTSDFPIGQWYHMTVTWNRQAKTCKTYLNAVLKTESVSSPEANVDLFDTGETHYEIGGDGGKSMLNGWISQLVALPQELKQNEIEHLKDSRYFGAWIGLNDIDKEGTLKWSDNKPLTYLSEVQNQDPGSDCAYLRKDKGSITTWSFESCSEEHSFICEKL
ncbi:C-type mannose receptor 2 [Exaiptasia diaphana]|nr:C-type mannose receptor 2 [Exaiptasia diaphana]